MEKDSSNTEKIKEFKSKFTKQAIDEYYESTAHAITFFEIQLIKAKAQQKEIEKKFKNQKFFDNSVGAIAKVNSWMYDKFALLEMELMRGFKNQIELIEAKIAHLKTMK